MRSKDRRANIHTIKESDFQLVMVEEVMAMSLKPDEVTEDISLIRELTGQPPAPFRLRSE
ncbi:CIC_collapsed_G0027300.mRNA.1.CDS.1 [Saccharomyces cerevisiae]|nr:CIC_collapsed_G0027300.mRNA.1.CDS.1 [Saccharomyces cerevisiae]